MSATNAIAKLAAVVAGLGLVAMSFAFAPAAKADTISDLQAQINALLAQIAALQGGSASASVTFTMDQTIGSTGAEVTALQNWLISKGYSIPAGATGYFGAQTQAALAAYQSANGISPAAGYFGPVTRAKVNASGGTTTGGSTSTGTLSGNGRLTNVDETGNVESDLNEGDGSTAVVGVNVEATGGDVMIQRLDVDFDIANAGGSSSLDKYISSVAVYLDGKKLGSMDASDGDKDGRTWSFRFSDLNGVVKEGDNVDLTVEVTPVDSIGTNEEGDTITATIPSDGLRAVGSDGISETYVDSDIDEDFTVSSATTGTLTLTEDSDNPDDNVVKVDTDSTTEDVTLLSLDLKAKKQDVNISDLPVQLSITGVSGGLGGGVASAVQTVKLMDGSKTLKSKSITGSASTTDIVFDNIDQDISEDDTATYTVVATIKKQDGNFSDGSTLVASTTGSLAWDAEDANGDSVTPSGSAVGGTVTLQTTGITVTSSDMSASKTTATVSGQADYTQYSLKFKVTAGDDDLWVPNSASRSSAGSATAVTWATTTSSNSAVTDTGTANLQAEGTNTGDTGSAFKVNAGTSRTFTLNVTLTSTAAGYTGVRLTGIGYDTDSTVNNSVGSAPLTTGLDDFKTNDVFMGAPLP